MPLLVTDLKSAKNISHIGFCFVTNKAVLRPRLVCPDQCTNKFIISTSNIYTFFKNRKEIGNKAIENVLLCFINGNMHAYNKETTSM